MGNKGSILKVGASCLTLVTVIDCGASWAQTAPAASDVDAGPQGQLQEVTVTATKVATDLQKTPVTVQTVGGQELSSSPVSNLQAALDNIPSVKIDSQNGLNSEVIARGVGPGVLGGSPGVALLTDGYYTSSQLTSVAGYYDISRIEVQLGPQGTLYGKNAEGGVVNIITNDPTMTYGSSLTVGFGNYDLHNVQGAVNVPLSDSLALRIAGTYNSQNGYLSNGQDDNGSYAVRAKLLYMYNDDISAVFAFEYTDINDDGGITGVPAFVTASSQQAFSVPYPSGQVYQDSGYRTSIDFKANVGFADLTVLPVYVHTNPVKQTLNDYVYQIIPGIGAVSSGGIGGVNYGLGDGTNEESVEVRLASHRSSWLQWIVGAYEYHSTGGTPGDSYSTLEPSTFTVTPGAASAITAATSDSQAYFGQATVPVTDKLHLIGGLRYSKDKAFTYNNGATGAPEDASGGWDHVDYKLGATYQLDADSMLYLTYATGYRPGGFSPGAPYTPYPNETLSSFELGTRNEFLDHTLRVNADVFYYSYNHYQLVVLTPCGQEGESVCSIPGVPVNPLISAPKAQIEGAELAVQYLPTPADHISVSMALNDSKIKSNVVVGGIDDLGQRLPLAPVFADNMSYSHDFKMRLGVLTPGITVDYESKHTLVFPPSPVLIPDDMQMATWRVDAFLNLQPPNANWYVNLWGKNLTNEVIKTSSTDGSTITLAAPRTYGVTVSAKF